MSYFAAPKPGMLVVDGCAGSGGKTLHLANIMHNKGRIIALDPNKKKLEQLIVRIKRNGVRMVTIPNLDYEDILIKYKENADLVLIDVPCSWLGVLRRNPAATWHMNPSYIEEFIKLKHKII